MSKVVETINNDVKPVEVVIKKRYKTPEYILRANRKYNEKKKNDPEYIKQKLEKEKLEQQQLETMTKCPDYIKRAVKNYNERNKTNPEFIQKKKESQQKYREANRERLKEEARLRYHNKKLEKQKIQSQQIVELQLVDVKDFPAVETLAIV